jgi:hypothetical protein
MFVEVANKWLNSTNLLFPSLEEDISVYIKKGKGIPVTGLGGP